MRSEASFSTQSSNSSRQTIEMVTTRQQAEAIRIAVQDAIDNIGDVDAAIDAAIANNPVDVPIGNPPNVTGLTGAPAPRVGGFQLCGMDQVPWTGGSNLTARNCPISMKACRPVDFKNAKITEDGCEKGLSEEKHVKPMDLTDENAIWCLHCAEYEFEQIGRE